MNEETEYLTAQSGLDELLSAVDRRDAAAARRQWDRDWVEAWSAIGWLGSTDILQQTFQGAMTHTIAALMNAVDALHSRQDNMRVDLAKLQQRLK